jgi:hypothetical protein
LLEERKMYLYVAGGSVLALHTQSKETEVHSGAIERDPPDNSLRERSKGRELMMAFMLSSILDVFRKRNIRAI